VSGAPLDERRRRLLRRAAAGLGAGAIAALVGGVLALASAVAEPFPRELLARARTTPQRVVDREGRLLREALAPDGTRGRWVPLEEIAPLLVEATLVAEDRRFEAHPGVDPLALLRAARQNLTSLRRVSGASTLTMQLVRLLRPRPRTWRAKAEEALLALRLERTLGAGSKRAILEEYLNRAPYGGNVVGAEAGALRTFGKPARDLSAAEAALLAALPQGPTRLDPHRRLPLARRRAAWILDEMARLGKIDAATHARALSEVPVIEPVLAPDPAPTFVDWALAEVGGAGISGAPAAVTGDPRVTSGISGAGPAPLRTTLDLALQEDVARIARGLAPQLARAGAGEAAVVVLESGTGEVLAFWGPAARRRAPGSTLKPFAYALAIEDGRLTAASPLDDAPIHLETPSGDFAPTNYDGRCHGRVSVRTALANSLNIPAVLTLRAVGVPRMAGLLRDLGIEVGAAPGLGLVLGDARVSPVELAGAYACLARGGTPLRPRAILRATAPATSGPPTTAPSGGEDAPSPPPRLLSDAACAVIADILADDGARALTFGTGSELALPFPVAAKTGTSGDHRDNWVAGFTARHTVVVWVGNADGSPLRGSSGLEGAGPLFRAVVERLGPGGRPGRPQAVAGPLPRPAGLLEGAVCAGTGRLPGATCAATLLELFLSEHLPARTCESDCDAPPPTLRIVSPRPGERLVLDARAPDAARFLRLTARASPRADVRFEVDGAPVPTIDPESHATDDAHAAVWVATPGRHTLTVRSGPDVMRLAFEVRFRVD